MVAATACLQCEIEERREGKRENFSGDCSGLSAAEGGGNEKEDKRRLRYSNRQRFAG